MASLAVKYRPKTFDEISEQKAVTTILQNICESEEIENRNFLFIGPAGTGKAQPLYSKILTPDGYINMKDVKLGTEVFTHSGAIGKVSGVYPQGKRPIYEITLQDRTKIRVSDEHLNVVYRYNEDRKQREDFVLDTNCLMELFHTSRFKLRVDIPEVDWEYKPVPIDPYLLGILISDGSLHNNFQISNTEPDVCEKVDSKLREIGWYLKSADLDHDICLIDVDHRNHEMSDFKKVLQNMGLLVKSVDKHIPKEYLLNSKEVRLELLQGLFDGDGHIQDEGCVEYSTSSQKLSQDIEFLVRSLGIRDTVAIGSGKYRDKSGNTVECNVSYTHHLKIPNGLKFYSSNKHTLRYKDRQNPPMRNIVSIDYVGVEECQCIMVDHPDHTYLSDHMIPTHNTTSARVMANALNKGEGSPIEIDAASHNGIDSIRQIVDEAKSHPIGMKYKVFIIDEVHSLSSQAWQALLKTLEEGAGKSIFILCTTNPEKIPATILSRVQTFQLSKLSLKAIFERLLYVLGAELASGRKLQWDEDSVQYIAKLANGGMRDALTLLDKVIAYNSVITIENVLAALNLPSYDSYFELLTAYARKDNESITRIIHEAYNSGSNFIQWFEQFHAFIMNIVKYTLVSDINQTTIPSIYSDRISSYNSKHTVICLKLANKLLSMLHELKGTQYLEEVALTYMCVIPKLKKEA